MKLVFSKTLDGKKTRARIEGLAGFQGLGDNEAAARLDLLQLIKLAKSLKWIDALTGKTIAKVFDDNKGGGNE